MDGMEAGSVQCPILYILSSCLNSDSFVLGYFVVIRRSLASLDTRWASGVGDRGDRGSRWILPAARVPVCTCSKLGLTRGAADILFNPD